MTDWISKRTSTEAASQISALNIPVADLATTQDLAESPHLMNRGFWDDWKEGYLPGLPWQTDFGRAAGNAPDLGEHTDSVVNRVLELPDADIAGLRERGAFD